MKHLIFLCGLFITISFAGRKNQASTVDRYDFPDIIDIRLTPDTNPYNAGCFTDGGAWMGFTIPENDKWVNGFCGPFSIGHRIWFSQSVAEVGFATKESIFTPDSTSYFPGEVYMESSSSIGRIQQRMIFVDAHTALLHVTSKANQGFSFSSHGLNEKVHIETTQREVTLTHENGEIVQLHFQSDVVIQNQGNTYHATTEKDCTETYVAISFYPFTEKMLTDKQKSITILTNAEAKVRENESRWNNFLSHVLRDDMNYEYDRIAAKAIVTLLSNWRCSREDLLHEGIIPSHAVHYFVGFWAWDSWRFSAALAPFFPELAKNNIRAMFDYQQPDGMVIDCIYTDSTENNARDSKPPLACWAVDEIFTHQEDTAFLREMYPKLLSYYKWWYTKRDHDQNGMCEFGSTDGTREAAAWESGMDNAIRFDNAQMVKNTDGAWSLNQESVDLNAYLALECKLLKKFAKILSLPFDGPDYSEQVSDYFFNTETNFFGDRTLEEKEFISDLGCEGYIPFWTKIATQEQIEKALPILTDTTKFSTYIPFPTAAADNPKCNSDGYWRGPIWLDQTYFAIKGLRNYGYSDLADKYTLQVFNRLDGLIGNSPIHENYGTHTGQRLQAPHFSWSSSHLLMMYLDYRK